MATVEGRVAKEEAILSALRCERRALVAGVASGKARKNEKRNAALIAEYRVIKSSHESLYGKIAALAKKYGCSKRHVLRLVKG
jgi:hypothetical protein